MSYRPQFRLRRPMQAVSCGDPFPRPIIPVQFRWMLRRDFVDVLSIEAASFDRPRDEAWFLGQLKERNCIGYVACRAERNDPPDGGPVLGSMVFSMHPRSLHVLAFAVDPAFRLRGVGSQMAAKLASKLSPHRRTRIVAVVREPSLRRPSTLAGPLFLKAAGYRAVDIIRGHYGDTGEDGIIFRYDYRDELDTGCHREGEE